MQYLIYGFIYIIEGIKLQEFEDDKNKVIVSKPYSNSLPYLERTNVDER